MKTILNFIILLLICFELKAQNLIPNSDFEKPAIKKTLARKTREVFPGWDYLDIKSIKTFDTLIKPYFNYIDFLRDFDTQYQNLKRDWILDINCQENFKSEIFLAQTHECDVCFKKMSERGIYNVTSVDTCHKHEIPHGGNCYINNFYSFKKSLFQVKLDVPLNKDSVYFIELFYELNHVFGKLDTIWPKGQFGLYFTNTDFNDTTENKKLYGKILYCRPQIEITKADHNALNGWIKFSCSFKIGGNYKYMIIGNFQPFNIPEYKPFKYNILSFCIDDAKLMNYRDKFKEDNVESGEEFLLRDVSFENEKLTANSYKSLNLLFNLLKNSSIEVLIKSYSKNESNEANVNRAKTIADYLTSKGIASSRIQYKGFGKATPVLSGYKVEGEKPQNQWIIIEILKK